MAAEEDEDEANEETATAATKKLRLVRSNAQSINIVPPSTFTRKSKCLT